VSGDELIAEVERQGGSLEIHGDRIRYCLPSGPAPTLLEELRTHRKELLEALRRKGGVAGLSGPVPYGIRASAVLLAPRFNGGAPIEAVPTCWCCRAPYRLDWLQEWQGRDYVWLVPSCGCLDAPQALACCGLCSDHCQCRRREGHEP
jgi:hypothetical protein